MYTGGLQMHHIGSCGPGRPSIWPLLFPQPLSRGRHTCLRIWDEQACLFWGRKAGKVIHPELLISLFLNMCFENFHFSHIFLWIFCISFLKVYFHCSCPLYLRIARRCYPGWAVSHRLSVKGKASGAVRGGRIYPATGSVYVLFGAVSLIHYTVSVIHYTVSRIHCTVQQGGHTMPLAVYSLFFVSVIQWSKGRHP